MHYQSSQIVMFLWATMSVKFLPFNITILEVQILQVFHQQCLPNSHDPQQHYQLFIEPALQKTKLRERKLSEEAPGLCFI